MGAQANTFGGMRAALAGPHSSFSTTFSERSDNGLALVWQAFLPTPSRISTEPYQWQAGLPSFGYCLFKAL
jgi:hypothetical protein